MRITPGEVAFMSYQDALPDGPRASYMSLPPGQREAWEQAARKLVRAVYRDVRNLAEDYHSSEDALSYMPFMATLDQLMTEVYGVREEENGRF